MSSAELFFVYVGDTIINTCVFVLFVYNTSVRGEISLLETELFSKMRSNNRLRFNWGTVRIFVDFLGRVSGGNGLWFRTCHGNKMPKIHYYMFRQQEVVINPMIEDTKTIIPHREQP